MAFMLLNARRRRKPEEPTMQPMLPTVVVARADLTPALRERLEADASVIVFGASEADHALEVIADRRPGVVALERLFAETPAGSDFLASVRKMPFIASAELRLLHDEGTDIPVLLRRQTSAPGRVAIATTSQVLSHVEPRKTPRYKVANGVTAVVNGAATALVDVSIGGAQVLALNILRPRQRVRVALQDDNDEIRVRATIAWSIFEQCRRTKETRFRAGVEFQDAQRTPLETYCLSHRQNE
jgi:hypothetical protein